ncbi:DUF805 domain-containing protein [Jannaschia sp. CCS1]|uniref:DUF805 domain-containing protein n=1 Tax=Jannaschia sp. (strain CCS1) TaxID=290400 RepID=UPI000053D3B2|nr:DUF805 domain-containing protein [Jannaschia sp. CCS1]ABD56824.1 protein of unknown function DUF805 [Jannaschia sp. CCS1]
MDFMTAVKHVLNNYANFSGRARRSEYWWWTLATIIFQVAAQVVVGAVAATGSGLLTAIIGIPVLLAYLAIIIPSIAVAIRRMHDVGRSGWWLLIGFVPVVGFFVLLYWFVQRGTVGSNAWGADPYDA